ncbi:hypothetical protein OsccyDRAFT_3232 [Leptolyngbyaceae cyanobacterium JSC-12]|nr:hypothetical protein OsccyDRAFT_3232 [Leptolyngbyaceae cyanobacterium JSC-12]
MKLCSRWSQHLWQRLLKRLIIGGLTVIALGNSAISAIATSNKPASFSPSTHASQLNFLLAQRLVCRRVIREGGTPFYPGNLPQPGASYQILNFGTRVGVDQNNQATRAPDGRFYVRVAYPFGSTLNGYVPDQYEVNGNFRSTLGACEGRPARW